jgi:hypothetical protein
MIIATAQPYFAPYPGFLYKVHLADILVLLDQVQFPRGTTWISRNRFKNDQGTLWLTVPVWKKGLGLQPIDKVRICYDSDWVRKHLQSLRTAYANAPFIDEHFPYIEKTYRSGFDLLIDINMSFIQYLLKQYRIDTEVIRQSELGIQTQGNQLLVDICRRLNATAYLSQKAARKYIDSKELRDAGVALRHFRPPARVYPQLWGPFIENLSSFDLLFNCGPKAPSILKKRR